MLNITLASLVLALDVLSPTSLEYDITHVCHIEDIHLLCNLVSSVCVFVDIYHPPTSQGVHVDSTYFRVCVHVLHLPSPPPLITVITLISSVVHANLV